MTLYELKIGKSKKKMHTQMIAPGSTINTYLQSRNASAKQINALGDCQVSSVMETGMKLH